MMPQCPLMFLHGTAGVKKIMVSAPFVLVSTGGGGSCSGGRDRGRLDVCVAVSFDDEATLDLRYVM